MHSFRLYDERYPSAWHNRGNSLMGMALKAEYNAYEISSVVALHLATALWKITAILRQVAVLARQSGASGALHYVNHFYMGSQVVYHRLMEALTSLGLSIESEEVEELGGVPHMGWWDAVVRCHTRLGCFVKDLPLLTLEYGRVGERHDSWRNTAMVLRHMICNLSWCAFRRRFPPAFLDSLLMGRLAELAWGGTARVEGDWLHVSWEDGPHSRVHMPPPLPIRRAMERAYRGERPASVNDHRMTTELGQ
jgi:hypothetical protein